MTAAGGRGRMLHSYVVNEGAPPTQKIRGVNHRRPALIDP